MRRQKIGSHTAQCVNSEAHDGRNASRRGPLSRLPDSWGRAVTSRSTGAAEAPARPQSLLRPRGEGIVLALASVVCLVLALAGVTTLFTTRAGGVFALGLLTGFALVAPLWMRGHVRVRRLAADVSERAVANGTLQQRYEAALESSRLKSEFLANMSHEIRTPLSGVVGMTELLLETPLNGDQRDYVKTAHGSARSLLTILNDILDFSKIEAGKLELDTIAFDPRALVEDIAELLAPRAAAKRLALMTYVAPEVPAWLCGDPSRLRQILLNLTGNALTFTDTGEVFVSVGLDAFTEADTEAGALADAAPDHAPLVRFEVSDTGIGLSADARKRLFEPFTSVSATPSRRDGGNGLGLSIAKRLAELMGGTIGVESEQDFGSTFWFTANLQRVTHQAPSQDALLADFRGRQVVVVDALETQRKILRAYITAHGLRVAGTSDASSALALLRRQASSGAPVDVVLLDLATVGDQAGTIARGILSDHDLAATRLILLTPFEEAGLGQRALRAGFAAHLTKPIRQAALVETLARVLSGTPATAQIAPARPMPSYPLVSAADTSAPRVLLAEDNAVNQKLALLQLQRLGCVVDVATDGQQVLDALDRQPYALVFMDCNMPGLDGFKTTEAIRAREAARGQHVPIIAMTANAFQDDRDRCLASGMDDYIAKPVTVNMLHDVLSRWLPTRLASTTAVGSEQPMPSAPIIPLPDVSHVAAATISTPSLPTVHVSRSSAPLTPPPTTSLTVAEDITARTILLVDDNTVNQKLTLLQLQKIGYEAQVAGNGRKALEALAANPYALVLMDCNMPEMDGYEATRAIRAAESATGRHLPIIAVTANAGQGDADKCFAAGMDDYIPKPVKMTALRTALTRWMPSQSTPATPATPPEQAEQDASIAALPAARSSVSSSGAVDFSKLSAIRALQTRGEPDVVLMVLEEYRQESRQLVQTLRQAYGSGDATTLNRAAHSLKSSSGYIGAQSLATHCAQLEALTKTGQLPLETEQLVTSAEAEYDRVLAAIDHLHPEATSA